MLENACNFIISLRERLYPKKKNKDLIHFNSFCSSPPQIVTNIRLIIIGRIQPFFTPMLISCI